jgi:hypothetical protein
MPHSTGIDIAKVLLINFCSILITAVNFREWLSILALSVSLAYTVWKWRNDYKKSKSKKLKK